MFKHLFSLMLTRFLFFLFMGPFGSTSDAKVSPKRQPLLERSAPETQKKQAHIGVSCILPVLVIIIVIITMGHDFLFLNSKSNTMQGLFRQYGQARRGLWPLVM